MPIQDTLLSEAIQPKNIFISLIKQQKPYNDLKRMKHGHDNIRGKRSFI
jgi:hypothetical protein